MIKRIAEDELKGKVINAFRGNGIMKKKKVKIKKQLYHHHQSQPEIGQVKTIQKSSK